MALQITLFAHPHRMSSWHSINNMDYELERVQWDLIPGYIPLHRYQRWAVVHVADSNGNLYGREIDDLPEGTSNEDCPQVCCKSFFLLSHAGNKPVEKMLGACHRVDCFHETQNLIYLHPCHLLLSIVEFRLAVLGKTRSFNGHWKK